jgi:CBS domain-containing protein
MRLITFLKGVGLGAGLMYLFDPDMGRRRRALIRDQAVHTQHVVTDRIESEARHLRNQAQGLIAETRSTLSDRLSSGTTRLEALADPFSERAEQAANSRLLESIVGGLFAYYGTRKGGLLGAAASMAGLGLLSHSVTDSAVNTRRRTTLMSDTERSHPTKAMLLRDIMTRNVETIHPDALLKTAAEQMKRWNIGVLPVSDGHSLLGILTDRDIAIRSTAEAYDPMLTTVRDAMTPEVVTCFEDQTVDEAARLMAEKQIRRLPILSRDWKLVGIVSLGDLAVDTQDIERAGEVLERVSEPSVPKQ